MPSKQGDDRRSNAVSDKALRFDAPRWLDDLPALVAGLRRSPHVPLAFVLVAAMSLALACLIVRLRNRSA